MVWTTGGRFGATLWCVAMVASTACNNREIEALADEPVATGDIVAVFPPDGALMLWGSVPIQVVLGDDARGEMPTVSVTKGGLTWPQPCILDASGTLAGCGVVGMDIGDSVILEVSAGDTVTTVHTQGRVPYQGLGWSLLDGVKVTAVGAGGTISSAANLYLSAGHAICAIDAYDGTSGAFAFTAAPTGYTELGQLALAPWGFGFVLPIEVDDGFVHGEADTAWLPTEVGGHTLTLLLLDVEISGRLVGDRLDEMVMTAALPARSVVDLADAIGLLGPLLLDAIKLDVDLDGDGVADAATLRLEGSPDPTLLWGWTP